MEKVLGIYAEWLKQQNGSNFREGLKLLMEKSPREETVFSLPESGHTKTHSYAIDRLVRKSLEIILSSRVILFYRIQQKTKLVGEKVLLRVMLGVP
jgi:hypothetical protein